LDVDYENLRAALEFSLEMDTAEPSLRLCAALEMYWHIRGYWIEGSKWLIKAFEKPKDDQNQKEELARAGAYCAYAHLAENMDDFERGRESAKLALGLAKQLGNKKLFAISEFWLGHHLRRSGKKEDAFPLIEESYNKFQELGELPHEAFSYGELEDFLFILGKRKYNETGAKQLDLARKAGERNFLAHSLASQAETLFTLNKLEESLKHAEEADRLFKQVGSPFNTTLILFGRYAWIKGDFKKAEKLFFQAYDQFKLLGEKYHTSLALFNLGWLVLEKGNPDRAEAYIDEIKNIWGENIPKAAYRVSLIITSLIYYLRDKIFKCKQTLQECAQLLRSTSNRTNYKFFLLNSLYSIRLFKLEITASVLGAIHESEKDPYLQPADPLIWRYYERAEAHLREALGKEAFDSAFAEGQKMSLEEALDFVLKSVEEVDE